MKLKLKVEINKVRIVRNVRLAALAEGPSASFELREGHRHHACGYVRDGGIRVTRRTRNLSRDKEISIQQGI